jgi:hypothetical protein
MGTSPLRGSEVEHVVAEWLRVSALIVVLVAVKVGEHTRAVASGYLSKVPSWTSASTATADPAKARPKVAPCDNYG